ncbi:YqiA/YcfP family alpha/beta fold hydrolase [Maribacter litoralis]|uniref:Pimeloyl-ACP methyl ester carboxylesterase n=1 Tax=Maribacter litoralis TaxID=2059726 RepID=A0A653Y3T8_9FLAO|nr:YqiA/YcfP family alpha/beta fold hydrolase [Maribacter litoralis]VXC36665.1 Pimeloyl-ACP methyl ester carboxylesterase [Maribacter litoralis]
MKVYGISGLGADKRVFNYLNLELELISIDWISPYPNESIKDYSKRLSTAIDNNEEFCLIGVSFGGLIATEISQLLKPKKIILISSVHTEQEIRPIYKWIGKLNCIKFIPTFLFKPPHILANYLMGAKNTKLLTEILNDTDLSFVKWVLHEFITWKNINRYNTIVKINGTSDKLIPPRGNTKMHLIQGGEHFMIVDRAHEISEMINLELR